MEWTETQKKKAWNRAIRVVEGYNPDQYRKDCCGAWIQWDKYGDNQNTFGWEIDHILPISKMEAYNIPEEEMHDPNNLRAMQHSNNSSKGDDYPEYNAVVTSNGESNIRKTRHFTVSARVQDIINSIYWWYMMDDDDIDYEN